MTGKEQKLHEELQKCRMNIQRTKELIAFHRDVLRKQEHKADELKSKLDAEKMKSLYSALHASGVDIDSLRQAVENGQITDKTAKPETAVQPATDNKKEDSECID